MSNINQKSKNPAIGLKPRALVFKIIKSKFTPVSSKNESNREYFWERKGAIQCISSQKGKFISNLFLMSKKDGYHKPVINLKSLNNFLRYHHFKIEGLNAAKDLLQQNDYMCKIDLKDAYFCIPLHRSTQRFKRFQ